MRRILSPHLPLLSSNPMKYNMALQSLIHCQIFLKMSTLMHPPLTRNTLAPRIFHPLIIHLEDCLKAWYLPKTWKKIEPSGEGISWYPFNPTDTFSPSAKAVHLVFAVH